jgi:hypothetical protein
MPDAGDRRIAVLFRAIGQQLVRNERAIRPPGNDVGKGAAAVDPELPALHVSLPFNEIFQWVSQDVKRSASSKRIVEAHRR